MPAIYASQITNIPLVERTQHLDVVPFEPCAVGHPPLLRPEVLAVQFQAQLHHFVQLILEALFIGSHLPQYFVPVEAEYELWLISDSVVPGDLGGDIRINFDDFEEAIICGEALELLVCDDALGVPVGPEVDERVSVLVLKQMLVEALQAAEAVQVGVEVSRCVFKHG